MNYVFYVWCKLWTSNVIFDRDTFRTRFSILLFLKGIKFSTQNSNLVIVTVFEILHSYTLLYEKSVSVFGSDWTKDCTCLVAAFQFYRQHPVDNNISKSRYFLILMAFFHFLQRIFTLLHTTNLGPLSSSWGSAVYSWKNSVIAMFVL